MRRTPASFAAPFALLAAAALAAPVQAADLDVAIRDARSQAGQFRVALVDAAGYAGKAAPIAARLQPPSGDVTRVRFADVPSGRYALMVIHDENGNGTLDTNVIGMPVEGYGFSNNPQVMRKPTWEESRFELDDDALSITIDLR